jgi:ketosteroid isomerase-like protein
MAGAADLVRALLPGPEFDLARVVRDEEAFRATIEASGGVIDPNVESSAPWMGEGRSYRGLEGFRSMWLDWLEPWATYHTRVEGIVEEGDRVLVLIRDRGRPHDSDAEVELVAGSVWTVRDGKIARVEFYANRGELFEATGLDPPA